MDSKFIDTEFFDLSPIYRIGRSRSFDYSNNLELFDLSPDEKASLNLFTSQLMNFLNFDSSQKFNPFFIEISLYEPTDPEGHTFYTLFISKEALAFDCYKDEMKKNIESRVSKDNNTSRGIIIPNPYLYNSPHFHYPIKSNVKISNNRNALHYKFGYFKDPVESKSFQKFNFLQESVAEFFKNVTKSFEAIIYDNEVGDQLNTVMLIPLYRPVSTVNSQSIGMFKGGGIFLYGATENDFNIYQFIVELSSILTKSVFKQAFSQIEEEITNDKLSNIELDTFHYLRNKLQHLPHYLRRIRESVGKISIFDTKNSIEKTEEYISNITDRALLMLSAYRQSILPNHTKFSFRVSDLGKLLNNLIDGESSFLTLKLEEEIISNLEIIDPKISDQSLSKPLGVHTDILFGVVISYIQNSAQAYLKDPNNNIDELLLIFSIEEKTYLDLNVLEFKIFNSGTQIPDSIINELGITPIASDVSSGLGFIFIGKTLKIIGALKQPDSNRYFHLENVTNGVNFSFKIRI